ncbi:MAG: hypothetical protein HY711_05195 [Candidatus Melainabacteria bacterium]|nr:hypothetical protein [Candidatus Melainabacteria bacterium]
MVIQSHMDEEAPAIASLCFLPVFCKHSRETPARAHPRAEQKEIDQQRVASGPTVKTSEDEGKTAALCRNLDTQGASSRVKLMDSTSGYVKQQKEALSSHELEVYEALAVEPIHVDALCRRIGMPTNELAAALTMLELTGFAKRLPGNQYVACGPKHKEVVSSQSSVTATVAMIINNSLDFIRCNFHGISRKYLQNYLAAYWCWADRTRWCSNSLVRICLEFGPVRYQDILQYVSPTFVKTAQYTMQA